MVQERCGWPIVHRHWIDRYTTVFNPQTGFFARLEDPGYAEPFWSSTGPELIDIAITNWCDRQCPDCYRDATTRGEHLSLDDYEELIRQAASVGTCQVALGGGNPNQHPDFVRILELTRDGYGIVPSYTTNGRGLTREIIDATGKWCGAVAVSAHPPYDDLEQAVSFFRERGIRTNIHFVLDHDSVETAMNWLRDPPGFVEGINALVFLNFKPVGRGAASEKLLRRSASLDEFYSMATMGEHPFKVGFDSCLASGLASRTKVNPVFYDACEAGRFSMFVSEKNRAFPCSFMAEGWRGEPLDAGNLVDVWRHGDDFVAVRAKLHDPPCITCEFVGLCRGGCPILPEIAVCGIDEE